MKNEILTTRDLMVQAGLALGIMNAAIAFATQNMWFAVPAVGLLAISIRDYAKLREDRKIFDKSAVKYFDGDNT